MLHLIQTVLLAAGVTLSATPPGSSCTVVQTGASQYEATVTWSGFKATSMELLQGSTVLTQTVLGKAATKGSLSLNLTSAPDFAILSGPKGRTRLTCTLSG